MICMQLKEMRDKLGWGNQELADKSDVPLPTIKRIMNQQTDSPTWQTVCSLVAAMGGSMDELAGFPPRAAPKTDDELLKQSLDAAQDAIQLCHKGLAEKNAELQNMRAYVESAQSELAEKNTQVEQLRTALDEKNVQLAEKDLRLAGHLSVIRSKNRWLATFFTLAMCLLVALVGLLLFDCLSPGIGFLRG